MIIIFSVDPVRLKVEVMILETLMFSVEGRSGTCSPGSGSTL